MPWKIEVISSEDGATWSEPVVVSTSVICGDIGITCNKRKGSSGRLILSYWKSGVRKRAYSDDNGATWTEGSID